MNPFDTIVITINGVDVWLDYRPGEMPRINESRKPTLSRDQWRHVGEMARRTVSAIENKAKAQA